MTETVDIKITKIEKSRVSEYDINNVPFGKIFADHMFIAEYANGKWEKSSIMPYKDMPMSYAMSALHYGQAIFEGMKVHRGQNNELHRVR